MQNVQALLFRVMEQSGLDSSTVGGSIAPWRWFPLVIKGKKEDNDTLCVAVL